MKFSKLLSGAAALAMVATCATTVFAADDTSISAVTSYESLSVAGNGATTVLTATAESAKFSVSVPTSLPVAVDSEGNTTTASGGLITNESAAPVQVTNVSVSGIGDWEVVSYNDFDMSNVPVGTKIVGLWMNNGSTDNDGSFTFNSTGFGAIQTADETDETANTLELSYAVSMPAFADGLADEQMMDIVFTIGWMSQYV